MAMPEVFIFLSFLLFVPSLQLVRYGFIGSHRLKETLRGHRGQTPAQNVAGVQQLAQGLGQFLCVLPKMEFQILMKFGT